MVFLLGKSGSGKSTLANLVAGFIAPDSGTVLLDGIPCDLTDSSWKHQVRIIPQNPYIFRGTLSDGVTISDANYLNYWEAYDPEKTSGLWYSSESYEYMNDSSNRVNIEIYWNTDNW